MKTLPTHLTVEQLKDLTVAHVARYESMLRRHAEGAMFSENIRPSECQYLLAIWKRIGEMDGSLESAKYTNNEISEIRDAWFDEYDSSDAESSTP